MAFLTALARKSAILSPLCANILGNIEIGVAPGKVLISLIRMPSSFDRKKSILDRSLNFKPTKALLAKSRIFAISSLVRFSGVTVVMVPESLEYFSSNV